MKSPPLKESLRRGFFEFLKKWRSTSKRSAYFNRLHREDFWEFSREICTGEMTQMSASIITFPAVSVNIRAENLPNFYNSSSFYFI